MDFGKNPGSKQKSQPHTTTHSDSHSQNLTTGQMRTSWAPLLDNELVLDSELTCFNVYGLLLVQEEGLSSSCTRRRFCSCSRRMSSSCRRIRSSSCTRRRSSFVQEECFLLVQEEGLLLVEEQGLLLLLQEENRWSPLKSVHFLSMSVNLFPSPSMLCSSPLIDRRSPLIDYQSLLISVKVRFVNWPLKSVKFGKLCPK